MCTNAGQIVQNAYEQLTTDLEKQMSYLRTDRANLEQIKSNTTIYTKKLRINEEETQELSKEKLKFSQMKDAFGKEILA